MSSPEQVQHSVNISGRDADWEYVIGALAGAFKADEGQALGYSVSKGANFRDRNQKAFLLSFTLFVEIGKVYLLVMD